MRKAKISLILGVLLFSNRVFAQVPASALQRIVASAMASHPAVAAQRSALAAAEEALAGARWQYFPSLNASVQTASAGRDDPFYNGDKTVTVASLTQPFWTWGRLRAGVDKATAQSVAAEAAGAEVRVQLAQRIIQVYSEWLAGYRKHLSYQQGVSRHEQLLAQVKRRIVEGVAAPSDLVLAEGRLAEMRADLSSAAIQQKLALSKLKLLSGQTVSSVELVSQPAHALSLPQDIEQILDAAENASPTLARLQAVLAVQQATIQEAQARALPEIQGRLEQQYGSFSTTYGPAPLTRVFVSVSSQLGAGLSSVSAINEARRRSDAAREDIESQQRAVSEQVMADFAQLQNADVRRLNLLQAAQSSRMVLQSWERQYAYGRKSWQEVMNSAREEVQLLAQLADLEANHLAASWRLGVQIGQVPGLAPAKAPQESHHE